MLSAVRVPPVTHICFPFFFSGQHMREVAERRQQLELEHEQALAILKFKQDEIKRLQRVKNTTLLTLRMLTSYLKLCLFNESK